MLRARRRAFPVCLALLLALAACAARAEDPASPEGYEDDYGFDDGFGEGEGSESYEDDYGFDDEESEGSEPSPGQPAPESDPFQPDRFWELSGDVSLGASYNYLNHNSATGTNYGNLARLRSQLDLQLDLRLPWDWKARIEGYGFYDWVYLFKGRSQYTSDVLEDYEWEVDFKELWVQGSLAPSLDLKLGRQIVNWGRSDTVRVLDVLNPLDNREPGLIDIEDLRLPVTMARVDYYPDWIPRDWGAWHLQLLVVPEFRQDRNPAIGNDFNPTPFQVNPPSDKPDRFGDTPEYGAAVTGTFSGWDLSVYVARVYLNQPLLSEPLGGLLQRYPLVTMAGAGGNLTWGSWLVKGEIAWFHGTEYNWIDLSQMPPDSRVVDKDRLDWMLGVEYYGVSDLSVAVEFVHRHIFDYDRRMRAQINGLDIAYAKEDTLEAAFRVTWDLLNQTLHLTGVALVLGKEADLGSVVRAEASYDVMDALVLTGGIVLYQEGNSPAFEEIGDNDRLFVGVEYSF